MTSPLVSARLPVPDLDLDGLSYSRVHSILVAVVAVAVVAVAVVVVAGVAYHYHHRHHHHHHHRLPPRLLPHHQGR